MKTLKVSKIPYGLVDLDPFLWYKEVLEQVRLNDTKDFGP